MKQIQKEIKEAKGKFFKRLSKTIFDERVESCHLLTLKQRNLRLGRAFEDSCTFHDRKDKLKDYSKLNELLAILRVLEAHYKLDIEYYDPIDTVEFCILVRKKLMARFWEMMEEKIGLENFIDHKLEKGQAYKELVHRGFKPNMLLDKQKVYKKDFFLISNDSGIVHPINIKDVNEAQKLQQYLGIMGYVGYNDPNRKN